MYDGTTIESGTLNIGGYDYSIGSIAFTGAAGTLAFANGFGYSVPSIAIASGTSATLDLGGNSIYLSGTQQFRHSERGG